MQLARRHHTEFFLLAIVAIGLTLSLAVACSSSKEASKSTPTTQSAASPTQAGETEQTQTLKIEVKEWTIADEQGSSVLSVKAGEVTFEVHNGGEVTHEFVVIKTDDPANLPLKGGDVDEEAAGAVGEVEDIAIGQTKAGTLALQPGTYAVICNLPAHYKQGMHALLTVE